MPYLKSVNFLSKIVEESLAPDSKEWLEIKIDEIIAERSTKKLYLTYTLCNTKIDKTEIDFNSFKSDDIGTYLSSKKANTLELARIFLLVKVLESENDFFKEKVVNLIQVADTTELETFLNYLVLLPNPEAFIFVAVEALRTNIETVFKAIAMGNPYPSLYFNEQQWNQMYLKAAFMQLDLSEIVAVDTMGNRDLARIISDYAHERWAASRVIDPVFWRPVSNFVEGVLLEDIKRLFESDNPKENKAAALVCFYSKNKNTQKLVNDYPVLEKQLKNGILTWDTFKN